MARSLPHLSKKKGRIQATQAMLQMFVYLGLAAQTPLPTETI